MNTQSHYYIFKGDKFDNMKDLCESIPNFKSKQLKNLIQWGVVEKVTL